MRGATRAINVLGYQTQTHLDYSFASRSRSEIIKALADLALAGTVHPYLKPETTPVCKGWLGSDTQTIASKISIASDMVLLPFVEAAADACRNAPLQIDRLPLSSLALAYMKLIEKEQVKDPAEITRLLIAARRNADDFISDDGYYSLLFGDLGRSAPQGTDPQVWRAYWLTAQRRSTGRSGSRRNTLGAKLPSGRSPSRSGTTGRRWRRATRTRRSRTWPRRATSFQATS